MSLYPTNNNNTSVCEANNTSVWEKDIFIFEVKIWIF
jgi:hypothetical protein